MNLALRSSELELLDREQPSFEAFSAAMGDLRRINRLSLGYRPTLAWLARAVRQAGGKRFLVLDVGFGQGDMLRQIARWGKRQGLELALQGLDLNPLARQVAEAATPAGMNIEFVTGNFFERGEPLPRPDYIVSSLLAHHLSDRLLLAFIREMEALARKGWFINDIHRHPLSYHVTREAVRLMGCHPIVRNDAPLSVARAFTPEEWRRLLQQSGEAGAAAEISWHFPFRLCVGRIKR